ncbi:MAG: tetratricopeptide repeat protein [Gemmatimonadota bacterium]|nr:tetratricopeptide repeat protein [Gemmatimonadota bacterium]
MSALTMRRAALAALVLGIVVYLNALGNGYAYDDQHILVDNTRIHSLDTFGEAITAPYWPNREGKGLGLWRPFATATYAIGWNAFDGSPLPFHVLNVLLHGVVSALTALLVGALTASAPAALLGGTVFALHPVHVEVVANVIGFAELWGAVTFLTACLLFLRWRETGFGLGRSLALTALFVWGILTKESAITLPGVFFLLDGFREDRGIGEIGRYVRERALLFGTLVAGAALVFAGRHAVLGSVADAFPALGADLLKEIPRIWTLGEIWLHYVRLLFLPLDLSADYSPGVVDIHIGWNAVNTVGAVLALLFLVLALVTWRSRTGARAIGAGVLWFVITISPVSNFFFLSGVLLGERTLYLPSVGLSLALGWLGVRALRERRALTAALLSVWLGVFAVRTWTRTPTWKSMETVFLTLMDEHLEAGRAQWVAGDSHWQENQVSEALRNYRYAIGTVGAGYSLLSEVTRKLLGLERWAQAEFLARMLVADQPRWDAGYAYVALALDGQGRPEEAVEWAERARDLDPDVAVTHHMLSGLYARLDRIPDAIEERQAAIDAGEDEHWQQWFWLAELHGRLGDTARGREILDSARVRDPEPEGLAQIDSLAAAWGPSSTP